MNLDIVVCAVLYFVTSLLLILHVEFIVYNINSILPIMNVIILFFVSIMISEFGVFSYESFEPESFQIMKNNDITIEEQMIFVLSTLQMMAYENNRLQNELDTSRDDLNKNKQELSDLKHRLENIEKGNHQKRLIPDSSGMGNVKLIITCTLHSKLQFTNFIYLITYMYHDIHVCLFIFSCMYSNMKYLHYSNLYLCYFHFVKIMSKSNAKLVNQSLFLDRFEPNCNEVELGKLDPVVLASKCRFRTKSWKQCGIYLINLVF